MRPTNKTCTNVPLVTHIGSRLSSSPRGAANMKVKILFVSLGLSSFLCGGARTWSISHGNHIREEDFPEEKNSYDDFGVEFYDPSDSDRPPIRVWDEYRREEGKLPPYQVDEETIRKAEKMADEDLLNGLNRILKNNETLEDVFRSENVYEIP